MAGWQTELIIAAGNSLEGLGPNNRLPYTSIPDYYLKGKHAFGRNNDLSYTPILDYYLNCKSTLVLSNRPSYTSIPDYYLEGE